ncbi:hypothetical protein BDR06DRAFT_1015373 [Suillus hirtellus]|nr:hypothetical protein BDR06DRAFT_1015373 [Suillus hirtellus]
MYKPFPVVKDFMCKKELQRAVLDPESVPWEADCNVKEKDWTNDEQKKLDESLLVWARWEVDYVNGYVRSSQCKQRTLNKSGICDVCERLAHSDQAFKHAIQRKTQESELPEEEQHELLLAQEKYTTPNTLRTTNGRILQDKLKDPVVYKIFKIIERGSPVECFVELFEVVRELKGTNAGDIETPVTISCACSFSRELIDVYRSILLVSRARSLTLSLVLALLRPFSHACSLIPVLLYLLSRARSLMLTLSHLFSHAAPHLSCPPTSRCCLVLRASTAAPQRVPATSPASFRTPNHCHSPLPPWRKRLRVGLWTIFFSRVDCSLSLTSKCACFFFLVYYDDSDPGQVAEEFLVAARAMARCVDLFCNVEKLLRVGFLLQQERVAENGELEELEAEHESRKKRLASLSTNTLDRYKRNYQQLLHLTPGLRSIIADSGKSKELTQIIRKQLPHGKVHFPVLRHYIKSDYEETTILRGQVDTLRSSLPPPVTRLKTFSSLGLRYFKVRAIAPSRP